MGHGNLGSQGILKRKIGFASEKKMLCVFYLYLLSFLKHIFLPHFKQYIGAG